MLINLSGCLGMSGFGNGFHCSKCVWYRSFLGFYRALKWRYDQVCVYRLGMIFRAVCERGTRSPLFKYLDNTQLRLIVIVA